MVGFSNKIKSERKNIGLAMNVMQASKSYAGKLNVS
jgi:hypothetical protein